MAASGSVTDYVPEFVPGKDSWEEYIERIRFHFVANNVTIAEIKRAILLSRCGKSAYSLIRSLCAPEKTDNVAFDDIVTLMSRHLNPKPSEISQRVRFQRCVQKKGQSITEFVAELRRAAEFCNYTDLEVRLRDQLVAGLQDEKLQERLLQETKPSFKRVFELAIATEAAQKNTSEMRVAATVESHKIYKSHDTSAFQNSGKGGRGQPPMEKPCFRCGGLHKPESCRFVNVECRFCHKRGHIQRVCLSRTRNENKGQIFKKSKEKQNHAVMVEEKDETSAYRLNIVNLVGSTRNSRPFHINALVNGKQLQFELDSGSAVSVISEETYRRTWPISPPKLNSSNITLRTWSQQCLTLLGVLDVTVQVQGKDEAWKLSLYVARGSGISLLGRDWFDAIGISIEGVQMNKIGTVSLEEIIDKHAAVFTDELGSHKGPPVTVEYDKDAQAKFLKCRPVPFAMREKVDTELKRLVQQGILEPVQHSKWATPIVPVLKNDGMLRICGDYRATVNTALKMDTYPLPTSTEIFASLAGCKKFVKFDMSQAYQQLRLDNESADLLTLNTPRGLFRMKRLPFGIASAPAIFQRYIDTVTAGLKKTVAYLDDMLVGGADDAELAERADELLTRLEVEGIRLKKEKVLKQQVKFLGFDLDGEGIHPSQDKVDTIHKTPEPRNKAELQAFLGLLNFYDRFLLGKATVLEPLHRLLDKDCLWEWLPKHAKSFSEAKELLQSSKVLVHYDPNRPLVLVCDASQVGVGAVLAHTDENGIEQPISFASRTLSKSERNYAQIQREALAIIFAVKKFHQFLFGRTFTIFTDHKPLLGLFSSTKRMPEVMNPQMLRWSLLLSAYFYELQYRPGKAMANADGLSRLPVVVPDQEVPILGDILMLENSPEVPIDSKKVGQLTQRDPVLSQVYKWVLQGFPAKAPSTEYLPFMARKEELSTHNLCLLWGSRIVIPFKIREDVLMMMHSAHPGIVHMKALSRSYVWWPGLDKDVERVVGQCLKCQVVRNNPSKAPSHPWPWPEKPWSRIHLDFAGPYQGKSFLLVVDAHSKWLEVEIVNSTSSAAVICKLRKLFATHGLPEVVVTDNGTAFVSKEFKDFLQRNLIRLVNVAPYHPASNGQAERYVQTTKQALKTIVCGDWEIRLARFLITQHVTPNSTTGVAPCELLMKRRLTTVLDKLNPSLEQDMRLRQRSKGEGKLRMFAPGDSVFARNYSTGTKWVSAKVSTVIGPVTYSVKTVDGQVWKRHVDQLRSRSTLEEEESDTNDRDLLEESGEDAEHCETAEEQPIQQSFEDVPGVRRQSMRSKKSPTRLKDFWLE